MAIGIRRPGGIVMMLVAFGCIQSACAPSALPLRVYRLAEMNTDQIRALDRERTVILIPGGIMEEHGPYLPWYSDGYQNERYTADVAAAIARRPGWTAVVFPAVPLGSNGANTIGGKFPFPGTYAGHDPKRCAPCSWTSAPSSVSRDSAGSFSFMGTVLRTITGRWTMPVITFEMSTVAEWSIWLDWIRGPILASKP